MSLQKKEQSHQEELTEQKATFQKMLDEVNKIKELEHKLEVQEKVLQLKELELKLTRGE